MDEGILWLVKEKFGESLLHDFSLKTEVGWLVLIIFHYRTTILGVQTLIEFFSQSCLSKNTPMLLITTVIVRRLVRLDVKNLL